ncbi:MAG: nucleoid-structuring protein H-NS [Chromatiaceae bacterium]|nr:aldolase catalytic domain-containing protein [Gammaproteobacteria bacterium]MCB1870717.1 aldolase catalytic domain-containing protein [Gammaproteobacteria bacterium]MCB1880359.1 aldolase catalytic domain-containing protein [Gammaproteobacteria bacterium]MCP5427119.1 nucleoid-structuring protein H-NS [Chromatiaceae bacterium]MCP5446914.1 nucleoid-structuring protein H-NS [Chromatiaceae bacterium]
MYRKELKVLDCTIRDGGLINNYQFSLDFVKKVWRANCDAAVDIVELGKKLTESDEYTREKYGAWNFCDDDDLQRVIDSYECENPPLVAVMYDVGRVDIRNLKPREQSPIDMVRVACYVHQIDAGLALVKRSKDLGYLTTMNIMAASAAIETELVEGLQEIEKTSELDYLYLVDSFGAFYSEQVTYYLKLYQKFAPSKELGFHAHNNQQLAFSNTQQAIIDGVNLLDATINGLGRGAGNCNLELLLNFLKNPKFDVRPIYKVIQEEFVPLREQIEWGFNDIYGISGHLNQHPREGMKVRGNPELKDRCYDFYLESLDLGGPN